jgi:uncharacterized protein (DUF1501 family)
MACAGTCGAALHRIFSPANDFLAFAGPPGQRVLILVTLGGGCSYNIANPTNSLWRSLNPDISYDVGVGHALAGNQQVLHPQLTAVKAIYDAGQAAVLNLVGYPNQNRSHDESTKIWETGFTSGFSAQGGWGSKVACAAGSLFSGIALAGASTLTQGTCSTGGGFTSLSSLQNNQGNFWWENGEGNLLMADIQRNVLLDAGNLAAQSPKYVRDQMDLYDNVVQTVAESTNFSLNTAFPNTGIGRQLESAARLIRSQVPVRIISCGMGGFDTHSNEQQSHNQLFADLNAAIAAFHQEMLSVGRWNDVTLITASEFSRIVFQNGSDGTDHGGAGVQFVLGGRVRGGVPVPVPSTAEINAASSGPGYFTNPALDFRDSISQAIAHIGVDPTQFFPAFGRSQIQLFS